MGYHSGKWISLIKSVTVYDLRLVVSREYFAMFLLAVICVLMSLEAHAQSTVGPDDGGSCGSSLPKSEEVAILIREGVEKVIASSQWPFRPSPADALKHALVSALVCEYGLLLIC